MLNGSMPPGNPIDDATRTAINACVKTAKIVDEPAAEELCTAHLQQRQRRPDRRPGCCHSNVS
jgi:hypothetical protein